MAIQRADNKDFGPEPFHLDKTFKSAMRRLLREQDLLDYDSALEIAPDGRVSTLLLRELFSLYQSGQQ